MHAAVGMGIEDFGWFMLFIFKNSEVKKQKSPGDVPCESARTKDLHTMS